LINGLVSPPPSPSDPAPVPEVPGVQQDDPSPSGFELPDMGGVMMEGVNETPEAPPSSSTDLVPTEDPSKSIAELDCGLEALEEKMAEIAGTFVAAPIEDAKARVQPVLLERIDIGAAAEMPRADLARQVTEIVSEI